MCRICRRYIVQISPNYIIIWFVLLFHPHIQELYNSIEKMRPNLFRMASELKQDEEGMAEILQTNETVIRVLDRYKSIFGEPPPSTTVASSSTTTNGTPSSSTASTATGGSGTTVTSSLGATGNIGEGATAAAGGGAGATAASKQDDVLIDLLDLDLGPPSSSVGGGGAVGGGNLASGSGTNLGSLLDDFENLSKEIIIFFSMYDVCARI